MVSDEPPKEAALSRYLQGQHVLWSWCEAALGRFREQQDTEPRAEHESKGGWMGRETRAISRSLLV